jgi:hypothetical protein
VFDDDLDLYAVTDEPGIEELPDGNALGCFFSLTTAGSFTCPFTSASSFTTASSASG